MCVGVDPTLINKVQDPNFLDQIAQTYKDISTSIQLYGPWSRAWVGEAGGAYNSGGKYVSHSFVDGFWFVSLSLSISVHNSLIFQSLLGAQTLRVYHQIIILSEKQVLGSVGYDINIQP